MPRGKGIYDDEDAAESTGETDGAREGETASGEDAPDVAKTDQEPTA